MLQRGSDQEDAVHSDRTTREAGSIESAAPSRRSDKPVEIDDYEGACVGLEVH